MTKLELLLMKIEQLNELSNQIMEGQIKQAMVSFGGGGLIITSKENSPYPKDHKKEHPDDLIIRTADYKEFSWLVYRLQKIDVSPAFAGELIRQSFTLRTSLKAQMLYVVNVATHKIYNNFSD